MERIIKVVLVDDNASDTNPIMNAVLQLLYDLHPNYQIQYKIVSGNEQLIKAYKSPIDIIMFDCNLSAGSFHMKPNTDLAYAGLEMLKEYRKTNKRTKVIFYSSYFDLESFDVNLSTSDFVRMINEYNVFKIACRNAKNMAEAIRDAIESLDTVLISMEELISSYGTKGYFFVDNKRIPASQLLDELKLGTSLGEIFRKQVFETILCYFMKFGE